MRLMGAVGVIRVESAHAAGDIAGRAADPSARRSPPLER